MHQVDRYVFDLSYSRGFIAGWHAGVDNHSALSGKAIAIRPESVPRMGWRGDRKENQQGE